MSETTEKELSLEGVERMALYNFARDAYLNYSMSVIRDRALPAVTDGLKPVQRRIIYAMAKLGIKPGSKHVKSARTVGEVLGKYHPHGDSACYEAMVLMAQPFSFRYPLIDGQGNWGDVEDPKSFAAMRYTESRLSKHSELLLEDLNSGCVEWIPNFDGTVNEPKALPSRIPSVLLNGTTGIAVGMATDIPPHNLNELVKAAVHLLEHPEAECRDLMRFIQGPDYPCGAEIITSKEDLLKMYETGRGTVRMRAVYEESKDGIIISALPYQVGTGTVEKQIAELMAAKKLPWVSDLINAGDHANPCRLIIVPRSNRVDVQALMQHLFALTDLECTYRVNLNILGLDGNPGVKSLKTILGEWLEFRQETLRRRFTSRLDAVNRRLHLIDGLLKVFLNLDEVIEIIRHDKKPADTLKERFALSDEQVEYILETKLRQLAGMEEIALRAEQEKLLDEKQSLEDLLGNPESLKAFMKKEMQADARRYGDKRRCAVVEREAAKQLEIASQGSTQMMTVVLSRMGWVRAATGTEIDPRALSYKSGDEYMCSAAGRGNQNVVFMSDRGRCFTLPIKDLPSARGQGEPISARFTLNPNESIRHVLTGNDDDCFALSIDGGYGFLCRFKDLQGRTRLGKAVITMADRDSLLEPVKVADPENGLMLLISRQGRMLIYRASELLTLPRGKGTKLMRISASNLSRGIDGIASLRALNEGDGVILHAAKGSLKISAEEIVAKAGTRDRAGEALPAKYQHINSVEIIPAEPKTDSAPAAQAAQDQAGAVTEKSEEQDAANQVSSLQEATYLDVPLFSDVTDATAAAGSDEACEDAGSDADNADDADDADDELLRKDPEAYFRRMLQSPSAGDADDTD